MLSVKNLCFSYGKNTALKGVSFSINNNEKVAVLGNNGSGKTTLFLCLAGVLKGYEGTITGSQNTGIVFQEPDVQIIGSTVEKEVSFGPINIFKDKARIKEQTDRAIEEMELTDLRYRPTHYLSGGEKKRVCIADIVAMESDVLIFDEPTAYLDPYNSRLLKEKLNHLHKKGNTIILSTHDMDFAYSFADRFIVLSGGNIAADGGAEIFSDAKMLKMTGLQKPMLFDVMEALGYYDVKNYPRNIDGLKEYIKTGNKSFLPI